MSDFARGTRGSSFIIEWCQITIRGRRLDQTTDIFALYAHYVCHRSSRYKKCSVQFSSCANSF
jgi:hypothetical protein